MLGGLSVPLSWGVAVPPDDYDHWAPKPEVNSDAADKAADVPNSVAPDGDNQRSEWSGWEGEAEPRFDAARTGRVIPHSPAAG